MAFLALFVLAMSMASAKWRPQYADNSPAVQAWFKQQHNSLGEWCCDQSDGHAYYRDYTLNEDGSVTVELDGQPHVIAAARVLTGSNPTGHAVWWFLSLSGQHRDYCFAPGSLG